MKILHSADWHLGVKNLKLPLSKQLLVKDEMLLLVQELFNKASQENFDTVLICGDLFHSKTVSPRIISAFLREVQQFEKPVLYIEGNHDQNILANVEKPSNLIMMDKQNCKFQYLDSCFYSILPEQEEFDDSLNNILLLHGHIENSSDNDYINLSNVISLPFDYIALGHVHQFKKYQSGEKIYAYSGSLFSNGFDECGDKGFMEVIVENKKVVKLDFVPFAKRRYMLCECDITDIDNNLNIIKHIQQNLNKKGVTNKDFVRVILEGTYGEEREMSLEIIKNSFEDYFYFEIEDKSRLKIDLEKIKNEKLSFKYEFVSLVENSDLSEEDKRLVCEIGLEALKGEGLNI